MRFIVVAFLLFLAACSSEQRMMSQTKAAGVSYDTIKDPKVAGRYEARMSLDPKKTVDVADAGIQALVNGLEAAQKDGYDLATYSECPLDRDGPLRSGSGAGKATGRSQGGHRRHHVDAEAVTPSCSGDTARRACPGS